MLVACFPINVLTMFAMVLAIGILVDDAIAAVENVERIMAEEGLSPKEANSILTGVRVEELSTGTWSAHPASDRALHPKVRNWARL